VYEHPTLHAWAGGDTAFRRGRAPATPSPRGSGPGPFPKPSRGPTLDEDREKGSHGRGTELGLNVIDDLIDDVSRLIGEPLT
jgi:hypothetical protein